MKTFTLDYIYEGNPSNELLEDYARENSISFEYTYCVKSYSLLLMVRLAVMAMCGVAIVMRKTFAK